MHLIVLEAVANSIRWCYCSTATHQPYSGLDMLLRYSDKTDKEAHVMRQEKVPGHETVLLSSADNEAVAVR